MTLRQQRFVERDALKAWIQQWRSTEPGATLEELLPIWQKKKREYTVQSSHHE